MCAKAVHLALWIRLGWESLRHLQIRTTAAARAGRSSVLQLTDPSSRLSKHAHRQITSFTNATPTFHAFHIIVVFIPKHIKSHVLSLSGYAQLFLEL